MSGFADRVLKLAAEKKAGKKKVKGGPAAVLSRSGPGNSWRWARLLLRTKGDPSEEGET
ncbi:hypothetical protein A2U01_0118109, partial [Trifolium medium]|nr:hypothetical protein [Trifolium medium]